MRCRYNRIWLYMSLLHDSSGSHRTLLALVHTTKAYGTVAVQLHSLYPQGRCSQYPLNRGLGGPQITMWFGKYIKQFQGSRCIPIHLPPFPNGLLIALVMVLPFLYHETFFPAQPTLLLSGSSGLLQNISTYLSYYTVSYPTTQNFKYFSEPLTTDQRWIGVIILHASGCS
jgi:hypothetical protein